MFNAGMLIAALISLSALLVNGQFEQNGFRKNRQLDLGLQDIEKTPSTEQSKPENLDANDFIPPLSNTYLPAKPDSAQGQQSFESASVNGKQKALCSAPFDSTLCKGDANVEKPSQDLVPPFNGLEEDQQGQAKASATAKPQSEETQTTAVPTTEQEPEVTTAKASEPMKAPEVAESSSPASVIATTLPSLTEITTTEKVADKAEITNDQEKSVPSTADREYLPPAQEISAAAQTNVAVIQPLSQAGDHDHRHHHHDENFDVCADAFHSFLCAPLKTRRRITGALPDKFKGSSSFLQYQKVLPNFGNQAASSNAVQNGYLPPKVNGFAANQVQSTFASFTTKEPVYTTPPATTVRPYSQYNSYTTSRPYSQFNTYSTSRPHSPFSQTSNGYDNAYIPPFTGSPASNPSYFTSGSNQVFGSRIPTTPTSSTIKNGENTFIPGSSFISSQPTFKTPSFPGSSTYKPFSANDNRYYLPPDSKLPAASFASPVQNYYQSSTSSRPQTSTFGSTESYLPPKYNYVNQKPAPNYQPLGSFNTVPSSPAYQTFGSFNTGTSSIRPTYTSSFAPSYKPFPQDAYSPSQPKYQAGSNYVSTTAKPFTTTKTSYNFNQAVTSQDKYYLPPDPKEPAAAQISSAVVAPQGKNPFHHGRDLCTDPFHSFLCSGPKPRKRITGALPSAYSAESTKTNEQRAPAPSNQMEANDVRSDKIAEGAQAQNFGYKYPTPSDPLSTPSATLPPLSGSTGYSYPKPEKAFPPVSQQDKTETITKAPDGSSPSISESKVVNGIESQPEETSSTDQSAKISTTVAPTSGYSYPRPQKTFPSPTEQKEIRQRPVESSTYRQSSFTGRGKGYQYSKPEQSFKLPEKKGYSYPKPEKRFELPTESRGKSLPSQTNANIDPVRNLGSADFIPVNKVDFKRSRPTNLLAAGLRRFGERLKIQDKRV